MKKYLFVLLAVMCFVAKANAEIVEFENINSKDFWMRQGVYEEKVLDVGTKLINVNKLDKRVVLRVVRNTKVINAYASPTEKSVNIYVGVLPYCDNDDELAAIIGHEIGHCLDYYDGFLKWFFIMNFNSKEYEYKADLIGIDMMVKAGYNPLAAICMANKVLDESYWDNFFFWTHPKGSKRALAMYKYIYAKYPWALKTDMVNNINYENFVNYSKKDILEFQQSEKLRASKRGENL